MTSVTTSTDRNRQKTLIYTSNQIYIFITYCMELLYFIFALFSLVLFSIVLYLPLSWPYILFLNTLHEEHCFICTRILFYSSCILPHVFTLLPILPFFLPFSLLFFQGTTQDTFLRENLEWLGKATNWAKFTAVASIGVVHKGHVHESMNLLQPYLPQGGRSSSPYSESGALYALGLIHANKGDFSLNSFSPLTRPSFPSHSTLLAVSLHPSSHPSPLHLLILI